MKIVISNAALAGFGMHDAIANAMKVADRMASRGLSGDVTPGLSVVDSGVEWRVTVDLYGATWPQVATLWLTLKWAFDLTCAWFEDGEGYAGCILKYPPAKPRTPPTPTRGPDPWAQDSRTRTAPHGDPLAR